jgi:hypothetical protein
MKKSKIISNFLPSNKNYSEEVEIKKEDIQIPDNLTIDKYQKDSKYIVSPSYVDKYNFITKDDILLE